jgi:serine/threonine protein kinase
MLKREVLSLESVQHPYILRLFEVVETLGRVHLVTEFIQGGELYYKIVQNGVYTEPSAAKIFKQIALAIQHMVNAVPIKARALSTFLLHSTILGSYTETSKRKMSWSCRTSM